MDQMDCVMLEDVIRTDRFQELWRINKDVVDVCRDCEFRYICTDCRAYTQTGGYYSKPRKCNYDPYEAKWSDNVL
jgi:radical SAM protein with 4Fe4S-binding SPASM domain